jgi:sulfite exporter TauE/SafE
VIGEFHDLRKAQIILIAPGGYIAPSLPPEAKARVHALPLPRREGMDAARLRPGILYNLGRVVSYTIVGGLVGGIGSAFSFSPVAKGALTAAAGLFMLVLGLKMLGLIPRLPRLSRFVPAALRRRLGAASAAVAKRGPLAVGLLNGLMPCGPLQTMQLYALGTGSALAGALSMLVFATGTVPLLLAFGLAATMLPRRFLPSMLKASAVLVMVLGIATFARAAALAGVALPQLPSLALAGGRAGIAGAAVAGAGSAPLDAAAAISAGAAAGDLPIKASIVNGVQTVTTVFDANDCAPFVVQAGLPVKWTIRIAEKDLTSCNSTLIVPGYGIQKTLQAGDNLIEFTPKASGVVPYSCWMGMIRSRITVVPDLASYGPPSSDQTAQGGAQDTSQAGSQASSLGDHLSGLLGQGSNQAGASGGPVPVGVIGMPVVHNGI